MRLYCLYYLLVRTYHDATRMAGGRRTVYMICTGEVIPCGGKTGDPGAMPRKAQVFSTGLTHQGTEDRTGIQTGHESRRELTRGFDVGGPMITHNEAIVTILIAAKQDFLGTQELLVRRKLVS